MTYDPQKGYDKAVQELQELATQHNELDARIKDFTEQAQNQIKQMVTQRDQLYVSAMQKQAIVQELQEYVVTKEVPSVEPAKDDAQESETEPKAEKSERPAKKTRK